VNSGALDAQGFYCAVSRCSPYIYHSSTLFTTLATHLHSSIQFELRTRCASLGCYVDMPGRLRRQNLLLFASTSRALC
jgi:hypothetical protein